MIGKNTKMIRHRKLLFSMIRGLFSTNQSNFLREKYMHQSRDKLGIASHPTVFRFLKGNSGKKLAIFKDFLAYNCIWWFIKIKVCPVRVVNNDDLSSVCQNSACISYFSIARSEERGLKLEHLATDGDRSDAAFNKKREQHFT